MRAFQVLKKSPLALDVYCWLTYRLCYLKTKTEVPWPALRGQFGARYPDTQRGLINFKFNFLKHLRGRSFCQMLWMRAERILHGQAAFFRSPSTNIAPAMTWSRRR